MADLIIKPSTGNNLVIQGGDNSPAITVGNTGTTTFAENATLSGTANNLGTITSSTTFPAGHVLQVKNSFSNAVDVSWASGSNFNDSGVEVSITPVSQSNKIFVMAHCTVGAQSVGEAAWRIQRRIGTGSWTNPDMVMDAQNSTSRTQAGGIYDTIASNMTFSQSCQWLDAPTLSSTPEEVDYRIEVLRWSSTVLLNRPYDDNSGEKVGGTTGITVMEVQQ